MSLFGSSCLGQNKKLYLSGQYPLHVKKIGSYFCANWTQLLALDIDFKGITDIGSHCFAGMVNLKKARIKGDNVKILGDYFLHNAEVLDDFYLDFGTLDYPYPGCFCAGCKLLLHHSQSKVSGPFWKRNHWWCSVINEALYRAYERTTRPSANAGAPKAATPGEESRLKKVQKQHPGAAAFVARGTSGEREVVTSVFEEAYSGYLYVEASDLKMCKGELEAMLRAHPDLTLILDFAEGDGFVKSGVLTFKTEDLPEGLRSVVLSNVLGGVTIISKDFLRGSKLKTITLEFAVKFVSNNFLRDSEVENLNIQNFQISEKIGDYFCAFCAQVKPFSVNSLKPTKIGDYFCAGWQKLEKLTLNFRYGVKEVGSYCFAEASNLKKAKVSGGSVERVGEHLFHNAKRLENLQIDLDGLKGYVSEVCSGCDLLLQHPQVVIEGSFWKKNYGEFSSAPLYRAYRRSFSHSCGLHVLRYVE